MTIASVEWSEERDRIAGSVATTLAMDRQAWEEVGASFTDVPDGLGGQAKLAVASLDIDGHHLEFGVLAYDDDDISHLLVGGPYEARPALAAQVVDELLALKLIPAEDAVIEVIGIAEPASVDDKLDYTIDLVEATIAEAGRGWQEQMLQMRALFDDFVRRYPPAESSTPYGFAPSEPHSLPILPMFTSGIRDLVTFPGISHGAIGTELVSVKTLASSVPALLHLQGFTEEPIVPARLMSFDVRTGEAVISVDAGQGRLLLIVAGLSQSPSDFEAISLPRTLGRSAAHVTHLTWQETLDADRAARARGTALRRRIRFRIRD